MHATKLIHAHALLSNNYLFMAIQFKQHAYNYTFALPLTKWQFINHKKYRPN